MIAADIDHPTDADLLEGAVRKLGGLVRRIKRQGAATRTSFRDRDRGCAAGRRMRQLAQHLRRRTGDALAEVDRLTARVAGIARASLADVGAVAATPAGRWLAARVTGGCGGWAAPARGWGWGSSPTTSSG